MARLAFYLPHWLRFLQSKPIITPPSYQDAAEYQHQLWLEREKVKKLRLYRAHSIRLWEHNLERAQAIIRWWNRPIKPIGGTMLQVSAPPREPSLNPQR